MNKELLQMIAICGCPLLFSLGGMIKKVIRRVGIPILLTICLLLGGIPLLQALGASLLLGVALCLPYGQNTPYIAKLGVFCLYGLPSLFIGFTPWVIIAPIVMIALFWVSNTKWGQNIVYHRVWEAVSGLGIGITYASLIK